MKKADKHPSEKALMGLSDLYAALSARCTALEGRVARLEASLAAGTPAPSDAPTLSADALMQEYIYGPHDAQ